jgi:hypothetical protein
VSSKEAQSRVIEDLKLLAKATGRTPSRDFTLQNSRINNHQIVSLFGSWSNLLAAAGLSNKKKTKQEIKDKAYIKNKDEIEQRKIVKPPKLIKALLCISDYHAPYGHPDTLPFLTALNNKYKFDHVLSGGDEIDGASWNFHDNDPDLSNPGLELQDAIKHLKPLFELFPNMDVLESNHGSLLYRKGLHHGIPRHMLKDYREVLGAPEGWKWSPEVRLQFSNGSVAVAHHGYSANALMASQRRGISLIQFHFHTKFSINYWQNLDELHWALQCGCMIDDTSRAFAYNKLTVERPIVGCAGVINGLPVLFPMILNESNRWTGYVP